jgi:hypothetical protein
MAITEKLAVDPAVLQNAAEDAYIFGYPLVLMDISREVMTNGPARGIPGNSANRLTNWRTFPDPTFSDVVSPSADALHTTAWLDLTGEPLVLSVPDTSGRYYRMPLLDAWTNVFAAPGKRTTGTSRAYFAITPPGWAGNLPVGVRRISAPTRMVWLIGRTQCNGPADYQAVHRIQDQFKLAPLSRFADPAWNPPQVPVDPSIDVRTPPVEQISKMPGPAFFRRLALLMKDNAPASADSLMMRKLDSIGIAPGRLFEPDSEEAAVLDRAVTSAQSRIAAHAREPGLPQNGWYISPDLGVYGTNYLHRAAVALLGLGANLPEDELYAMTRVDSEGRQLNGQNRYVLSFARDFTPPVNAFWSITMYNERHSFVPNPLNRYSIGDRDSLRFNADGSLDMYIQHASPNADKERNWLPAPADDFNLILRMYWPKGEALKGRWRVPGVQRI